MSTRAGRSTKVAGRVPARQETGPPFNMFQIITNVQLVTFWVSQSHEVWHTYRYVRVVASRWRRNKEEKIVAVQGPSFPILL